MRNYLFLSLFLASLSFAQTTHKNLITVSQDGSGDFTTVQAAFDAIPLNNTKDVLIRIKRGVYKEKLTLDSTKNHVTIMGDDAENTLLTYDDYSGKTAPNGVKIGTRHVFQYQTRFGPNCQRISASFTRRI